MGEERCAASARSGAMRGKDEGAAIAGSAPGWRRRVACYDFSVRLKKSSVRVQASAAAAGS